MSNHHGLTVSPQGLLQDTSEFGVSIVNIALAVGAEGIDAVCKGQERAVDVSAFHLTLPTILKRMKETSQVKRIATFSDMWSL